MAKEAIYDDLAPTVFCISPASFHATFVLPSFNHDAPATQISLLSIPSTHEELKVLFPLQRFSIFSLCLEALPLGLCRIYFLSVQISA